MRLLLEITRTKENKHSFKVFDSVNETNSDIIGCGWTVREAVDDFIDRRNMLSFYDDDTPAPVKRENVRIECRKIIHKM